ncbi:MAG: RidA family protein [Cyclobacteriaceae bacterium]|nr:RidA family protein [Cyclobacteriaceae bacterium]
MKSFLTILCLLAALGAWAQPNDPEKKLSEMGLSLPAVSKPIANYVKAVRVGNLVFLAGHTSDLAGKVGKEVTVEQGAEAARLTGLSLLASLKAEIGDLKKVKRLVKVLGMVNCTEGFTDQPKVMNGFSDLMVAVFGENGRHARSAVGMYALPNNKAVEIEMIVEVEN